MEFRPVSPTDLPRLAEAFIATFSAEPWSEAWTMDSALACLADLLALPRAAHLTVLDEGVCLGAIFGFDHVKEHGLTHEIKELFIHPQARGQGIGQALMVRYLTERHLSGVNNVYLLTARDTPSEEFYGRLGFRRARQQVVLVRP